MCKDNNNKFRIYICEDDQSQRGMIRATVKSLNKEYGNIEFEEINFEDILSKDILGQNFFDLLILDLKDETMSNKLAGVDCLEYIEVSEYNIPTIIYSGAEESGAKRHFENDYDCAICTLNKTADGVQGLKEVIRNVILKKILPKQYTLKNEFDITIKYQIDILGEANFNQIINAIKNESKIEKDIQLERMPSGYSGAMLFKLILDNTEYILKASNKVKELENELEKAKNHYQDFPPRFFNYINPKSFYSADSKVMGILIKYIEGSKTLFDTICKSEDFEGEVKPLLKKIFTDEFCLKGHYSTQKGEESHWSSIFEKISEKYSLVDDAIDKLSFISPKLKTFRSVIKIFVEIHTFDKIEKHKQYNKKQSVLCHGDLHAKNIIIQGDFPFLIDTGGIKYDYWCSDICRLIVNLFITGFHNDDRKYYDINSIEEDIEVAKKIIDQENIVEDDINDNFIHSINWLISNCEDIYGDLYDRFEYQLGLMKEFLQVSYRVDTIPHSKRAIALWAAYECLLSANRTIEASTEV